MMIWMMIWMMISSMMTWISNRKVWNTTGKCMISRIWSEKICTKKNFDKICSNRKVWNMNVTCMILRNLIQKWMNFYMFGQNKYIQKMNYWIVICGEIYNKTLWRMNCKTTALNKIWKHICSSLMKRTHCFYWNLENLIGMTYMFFYYRISCLMKKNKMFLPLNKRRNVYLN